MQPMGRRPSLAGKVDNHLRINGQRVGNWWEDEGCDANKKAARQKAKKELRQYLEDHDAA